MDLDEDIGLGPLVATTAEAPAAEAPASSGSAMDDGALALPPLVGGLTAGTDGAGAAVFDEDPLDGDLSGKKDDPRSRPWTTEEDEKVRSLVEEHGTKRWSVIAASLMPWR